MAEQGLNDINAVLSSDAHIAPDLAAKIYNPVVASVPLADPNESVDVYIDSEADAAEPTTAEISQKAIAGMRTVVEAFSKVADKDMDEPITRGEVAELKTQINDSFSEVANLVLDLMNRFDLLDQRIGKYNERSSHKL